MSDDLSIPNSGYRGNRAGRYGTGQGRLRSSMDPDTRRLVMFAGGLAAVLAVLIGASFLMGRRSTEVPVVVADTRPIRVKPDNPGGMKVDGAENDVFSGGSDTANAKLAAAAENPDSKALRTIEAPVADTPAPVAVAPQTSKPVAVAPPVSKPVAVAPLVSKPAVAPSTPPAAKPAVSAAAPASKPASAKAVAAVEPHSSVSGRMPSVQLAALASEDAAHGEWQALLKRMPELLNGRQPIYTRTERNGRTFWRVRTSGFADVAQARAFCEHVRTKGGGCSVADF